jgi:hypothetical protein
MKKYIIKKTNKKGKGLFASKDIKEGELVFYVNLSKQKSFSLDEINKHIERESNHWDYIGHGIYVLTFHPYSYMNHSCNPNILIKYKSMTKSEFIAMCNIKKGEELTYDYGVNALDIIGTGKYITIGNKIMKCKCGSKNCRKKIFADFFKQPVELQRKYYKYLPLTIKRKYRKKFKKFIE